MGKFSFIAGVAAVLTVAGAALATDFTKTGQVGDIIIHPDYSYDEVRLSGNPDICTSGVDSGWGNRLRIFHADGGYDALTKALLAAKLAGAQVKVTGTNEGNRCVLKTLVIVD